MSQILIVDDVRSVCEQYAYDLKRLGGYEMLTATRGREALAIMEKESVDCVILDLEMPGMDGFDVLKEIRSRELDVPVVVYTGTGNYDRCVRAVKLGAYTFIDKSEPMEKVVHEVEHALERGRLMTEVRTLRRKLGQETPMVGESPEMRRLREEIEMVAPVPSPVLVTGESGSGKELVARGIHALSGRTRGEFLAINCAALPENLVESELFGYEAGAFTGADRARKGAFETAAGGTLLLDEIGELPLPAQAKLLRVLEERKVTRVGGSRAIPAKTRVVAATNRNLEEEIAARRFRQDLFFRLNVHALRVPPLRERLSDVPLLAEHLLAEASERLGVPPKTLSAEALRRLQSYDWRRNNIRELRNVVERLLISAPGSEITAEDVPSDLVAHGVEVEVTGPPRPLKELKAEAERRILITALERNDWHISRTAEELGLADHSSLLKIMRRHDLKRP
jgi:two-component system nitrogen regulation response regulator NtrX